MEAGIDRSIEQGAAVGTSKGQAAAERAGKEAGQEQEQTDAPLATIELRRRCDRKVTKCLRWERGGR